MQHLFKMEYTLLHVVTEEAFRKHLGQIMKGGLEVSHLFLQLLKSNTTYSKSTADR